jgi:hypothetical protein
MSVRDGRRATGYWHFPFWQMPLRHWLPIWHGWLVVSRHSPLPSHACPPLLHVPWSKAPKGTLLQVPWLPLMLHDWQVPLQAVLQQTPSTQKPVRHCDEALHVEPLLSRHVPAPLHAPLPVHALAGKVSCMPNGMFVQVPREPETAHDWQVGVHALPQHTPSTQLPLAHWLGPVHVAALVSLGTHAPALQNAVGAQSVSVAQVVRHAPVLQV